MSIPLIQKPEKDDINTSIIAIKRNIERINMLLGLVDNDSPDLSGFATKQELQDAVTELQPVDEVTIGNMHSVSSNAVARELQTIFVCSTTLFSGDLAMYSGNTYTLYGAYEYNLLGQYPSLPQGWHYEFVLSAQGTTNGNGWFQVFINNIATDPILTWSGYTFRVVRSSPKFRLSDIILEPTYLYGQTGGCNLKIVTTSGSGESIEMHCYNINLTVFAVKD